MKVQFKLRDLLWLTAAVGLALGWRLEHVELRKLQPSHTALEKKHAKMVKVLEYHIARQTKAAQDLSKAAQDPSRNPYYVMPLYGY